MNSLWFTDLVIIICFTTAVFCNGPPAVYHQPSLFIQPENISIGSVLGNVSAKPSVPGMNLTFSVHDSTESNLVNLSSVTFNGSNVQMVNITLAKKLDRDREPQMRPIYITVTDGQSPVTVKISLYITDVNDEKPVFDRLSYRVTIDENFKIGDEILTVTATDLDQGPGGRVYYGLTTQAQDADDEYRITFHIDTSSGKITLKKHTDYEKRTFYQFKVHAWDTDQNESKAVNHANESDLIISIRDVQDTPPYFVSLPYLASVKENASVNSSVLTVTAYDGDRGIPNNVTYSLTGGHDDHFAINNNTGLITVSKELDADSEDLRNRGGVYKINVTATEVNAPNVTQLGNTSTTTIVSVTVEDVNDHIPTFTSQNYTASVQENTPEGVPITLKSVIEVNDSDQGDNSKFTIYLEKDGTLYSDFDTIPEINQTVFSKTNVIIRVHNVSVLDYEKVKNITFLVVAKETSTEELFSSNATVTLTIKDVNDNSPEFADGNDHFNVSEDVSNGTIVGSVEANDIDSGDYGKVYYELENEPGNNHFDIHKNNGSIFVTSDLDRETKAEYSLLVVAWDNENGPESARRSGRKRVKISLRDVNDNPPVFTGGVPEIQIAEDVPVNTTVLHVQASDKDLGDNGTVVYSISHSDVVDGFGIKKDTGEVYVRSSIIGYSGDRWINITATDKGVPALNATQTVQIHVRDVNLNPPQFVYPPVHNGTAQISVLEEQPKKSTVITLNATDSDKGRNGQVVYRRIVDSNNDWEYFTVNSSTGEVVSALRLDREKQRNFVFEVQAEDQGLPQLTTTVTLNITLLDVDDNLPVFSRRLISLVVVEENDTVCAGSVDHATDADEYKNHTQICYYLYGGELVDHFKLNKTTGELCLQKKLDRETKDTVKLVIQALATCDDSVPGHGEYNKSDFSMAEVEVKVKDVNDHAPEFLRGDLTCGILFNTELGKTIYDLRNKVSDADEGVNSVTYFRLVDVIPSAEIGDLTKKSPFVVDRNGSVVTNMLFSSAMLGHFDLKIQAYDIGNLTGEGLLKVFIISNIQRVKIVFRGKVPDAVREIQDDFIRELESVLGFIVIVDTVTSHQKADKTYDDTSTDMFIHARYNTTEGAIVPATELWRAFDFTPRVSYVFAKYGITETSPVVYENQTEDNTQRNLITGFVTVAVGLAILALALGIALYIIRQKYVRRLKSYSTKAEVKTPDQTVPPGTNIYASNPVYNKSISIVDEETLSVNSLDDNEVDHKIKPRQDPFDEQEMSVQMFGESHHHVVMETQHCSTLDAVLQRYEQEECAYTKTSSRSNTKKDEDTDSGTFMPLEANSLEHSDI